jgi:hypothetical protein
MVKANCSLYLISMHYPLPSDHWLIDPKYILNPAAEHLLVDHIDANFKEHESLEFTLELMPGLKTHGIVFRPYAGSQTYILRKDGNYFKALPCDSTFLILIPHETAKQLPMYDPELGVVLPANSAGVEIKKSKLYSGNLEITDFEQD